MVCVCVCVRACVRAYKLTFVFVCVQAHVCVGGVRVLVTCTHLLTTFRPSHLQVNSKTYFNRTRNPTRNQGLV